MVVIAVVSNFFPPCPKGNGKPLHSLAFCNPIELNPCRLQLEVDLYELRL